MALTQSKTYGSIASATSHSITLDAAPSSGNLLVLCVVSDTTVTGTPSGWSVVTSAVDFTGTYMYYKIAGVSESATISVGLSSSDCCALVVLEYSGNTATPLDKTASAIAQSSPCSTGTTTTTTQASEFLVALVGLSNATGTTPTSPPTVASWSNSFVSQANVSTSGTNPNVTAGVATLNVSATGTYSSAATLSGLQAGQAHNSGIIGTFKVAPATQYSLVVSARMCEFNVQRLA